MILGIRPETLRFRNGSTGAQSGCPVHVRIHFTGSLDPRAVRHGTFAKLM